MSSRSRIILYNPRAEFFTMPLALLSIGSALDPRRYEVIIVDGRMEGDPAGRVLPLLDDALCLGVTVLTGAPIRDALQVTRAAKARYPQLPVIWGGWHPSLFSRECLQEEAAIDAAVQGQGEETFREIVEALQSDRSLEGIGGCAWRRNGSVVCNAARPLRDINDFPAHDYGLIPVEKYFRLKRRRQLDYISSQGCHFRCSFCADPAVYERKWVGLAPERIGEEIENLWKQRPFEDVNFQDETFFTRGSRVEAIAEQFLERGLKITWAGTLRADQGVRLSDEVFKKCKQSGLRRVMIGVESGSLRMLEWMMKDITLEQVFETAEKCLRHRVAAVFPFIVGFPNEPEESVDETLKVALRLRSMSPDFEVAIFFYLPYPGSPIAAQVEASGFPLPRKLAEWSSFDFMTSYGRWVDRKKRRRVEAFRLYQRLGWSRPTLLRWPAQQFSRWRCQQLAGGN